MYYNGIMVLWITYTNLFDRIEEKQAGADLCQAQDQLGLPAEA